MFATSNLRQERTRHQKSALASNENTIVSVSCSWSRSIKLGGRHTSTPGSDPESADMKSAAESIMPVSPDGTLNDGGELAITGGGGGVDRRPLGSGGGAVDQLEL